MSVELARIGDLGGSGECEGEKAPDRPSSNASKHITRLISRCVRHNDNNSCIYILMEYFLDVCVFGCTLATATVLKIQLSGLHQMIANVSV